MRAVRVLCAVVLSAAALVAAGAATESAQAAGPRDIFFEYNNAIKGETIHAEGAIDSVGIRTVRLQYRTGTTGSWTTKLTTKSAVDGRFSFETTDTKTHYWRYTVPAGGGKPGVIGLPKKLPVVSQKVEYFGVGYECSAAGKHLVTAWADFFPARQYRQVSFATPTGAKTGYQDPSGIARVTVTLEPGESSASMKATASAADGAPAISSVLRTIALPPCSPA